MALDTLNFTTGPATLPDIGTLAYNGCTFSPLFESNVSGDPVKDNANRTVKYMDYTITVDGYVTAPTSGGDTSSTMATLARLLSQQGAPLAYKGRGFDIVVQPGTDVAWGPVPELLEFQPLGGGKAAKVKWQVKVRIPRTKAGRGVPISNFMGGAGAVGNGPGFVNLLQFTFDTSLDYDETYFATLTMRGTMEIPLSRDPTVESRTLTSTVDNYRSVIETRLFAGIDLRLFRVTKREFNISRDKRTMDWHFELREKPYMDLPPNCTIARGSYQVRPAKAGMGLVTWLCTLRVTYNIRPDRPRRIAWTEFLGLLRLRLTAAGLGNIQPPPVGADRPPIVVFISPATLAAYYVGRGIRALRPVQPDAVADRRSWLIDFSMDEGLYLDSATITFSASWRLITTFSHILVASGLWRKLPEWDARGNNVWATSMRDISGSRSWLLNQLDPTLDVIVDFGI